MKSSITLNHNAMISKHPIVQEFPEFLEKIKNLNMTNEEFQVLLDSYHVIDDEVYKMETNEILVTDEVLNQKRIDRVFLKDEIYKYLTTN
jgi:uncharacterized protein YdcH (DUF465 family)